MGLAIRPFSLSYSSLEDEAKQTSLIPMLVGNDEIKETIICTNISAGAAYTNNMPQRLTLERKLDDGTTFRAEYVQVNSDV